MCTFKTGSGVTQIEFSPCGTKLFSAVRRSGEFLCWDLRNPGTVLYSLQGRQSGTNQRIQFGIAPNGKQIVSGICIYDYIIKWYKLVKFMFFILLGGTDGSIAAWELQQANDSTDLNIIQKIELSRDSINGISLHNTLPIIATSTGQRLCGNATEYRDHNVRLWRFA